MNVLKKIIFSNFLFFAVTLYAHSQSTSLQIIPQPNEIQINRGKFSVNSQTGIVCLSSQMQKPAEILTDYLNGKLNLKIESGQKYTGKNQFVLKENANLAAEEYHITVNNNGVVWEASTPVECFMLFRL